MEYRPEHAVSGQTAAMMAASRKQRRHFRQKIHNLAYINLNFSNGGIIRNVSESGIAVQTVSAVQENQEVQLRFELLSPRTRVEATGRVAWTDANGQAGVEFIAVAPRSRRQLKEWLFTQLLGAAAQTAGSETIFVHSKVGDQPAELAFSASARPALRIEPEASPSEVEAVSWYPVPQSPHTLAVMIDSLIVAAAVLLFCVVSLAMTHVFPTWWLGLGLVLAAAALFSGMYWVLFVYWIGLTPGNHLARLTGGMLEERTDEESEEATRFR
jgi:PilZ domain-containing protein